MGVGETVCLLKPLLLIQVSMQLLWGYHTELLQRPDDASLFYYQLHYRGTDSWSSLFSS